MAGKGQITKRKDKGRIVLRTGEGQRPNGTYEYRWTDRSGTRRRVYAVVRQIKCCLKSQIKRCFSKRLYYGKSDCLELKQHIAFY